MKEIKCDFCKDVIEPDKLRIKGNIQKVSNEEGSFIKHLVWERMDFCDEDCLSSFLHNKIQGDG